jgi:dihydroorotase
MFKFLALGLTFHEVIDATTWKPALVVGREDLGHLGEGTVADIAVFGIDEVPLGLWMCEIEGWTVHNV